MQTPLEQCQSFADVTWQSFAPGSVKNTNWLEGIVGHLIGWVAKEILNVSV